MRAISFVALVVSLGCDVPDRLARLEKQNQELKAELSKSHAVTDYDLQAKCSRDARDWFTENWAQLQTEKGTLLLDFINHYNKKLNKCFIVIEYHYSLRGYESGSWANLMSLWDIYENSKYGDLGENHPVFLKPSYRVEDEMVTCELFGKKCKTLQEFNDLLRPYLND